MRHVSRAAGIGDGPRRPSAVVLLAVCAACGGPAAQAQPATPSLWPYTADAAKIFDDVIELPAVGYGFDPGAHPMEDKRVRERTQIADAVLRIRVTSVNAMTEGAGGWIIACHTLEQVAGKRPPAPDFNLMIDAQGPSASILRQFSTRVASGTFVVFVEEFTRADGLPGPQLHFHIAQDSPDEIIAIREAAAIGEAP
jgi:hypothetical protein